MPRYLVERLFDPLDDQQFDALNLRSHRLMQGEFKGIEWEHSHVVDDDGQVRSFCVYAAPDADLIRRHADAIGHHQIVNVYEIVGDVDPAGLSV